MPAAGCETLFCRAPIAAASEGAEDVLVPEPA
jgi:hypothetical protein